MMSDPDLIKKTVHLLRYNLHLFVFFMCIHTKKHFKYVKVVYTYHIFDLLLKVCTSETPITKLASDYTPSELEFFKKLVSKPVP